MAEPAGKNCGGGRGGGLLLLLWLLVLLVLPLSMTAVMVGRGGAGAKRLCGGDGGVDAVVFGMRSGFAARKK